MAVRALGVAPSVSTDAATKSYVDGLVGKMLDGGAAKTAAFSAVANTNYVITLAASLGAVAVTLPSAPPAGTRCSFTRTDGNALSSFCNITPGGTDTIAGTSPWALSFVNGSVTLIYSGTTWYVEAVGAAEMTGLFGPSAVLGSGSNLMSRNGSGQTEVATPTTINHATTKGYVDNFITPKTFTRVTAAGTLASDTTTLIDVPSSPSTVAFTLPATTNGKVVEFFRMDTQSGVTVTVAAGGTDTMEYGTFTCAPGMGMRYIYRSSTTTWHPLGSAISNLSGLSGPVSAATASTLMARDSSGRASVTDPSVSADIATKNYVDTHSGSAPGDQMLLAACFR